MSSFDYSRFDNLCDSDDESDAPAAAVPPVPPKRSTLADIAPELAAKIHRNLEDEEAKENVKAKVKAFLEKSKGQAIGAGGAMMEFVSAMTGDCSILTIGDVPRTLLSDSTLWLPLRQAAKAVNFSGVLHVSAKDVASSPQLVALLRDSTASWLKLRAEHDVSAAFDDPEANGRARSDSADLLPPREYVTVRRVLWEHLWELALSLRTGAWLELENPRTFAEELMDTLLPFMTGAHGGGWETSTLACDTVDHAVEFLKAAGSSKKKLPAPWRRYLKSDVSLLFAEMHRSLLFVTSILHEFCRFRTGCRLMAENTELLQAVFQIPTLRVNKCAMMIGAFRPHVNLPEITFLTCNLSAEQARLDLCGRLLNGLGKRKDAVLRSEVCAGLERSVFAKRNDLKLHGRPVTDFEWLADSKINGQVHYVDVGKTLGELSQKMSGSEQPWHSLHCLDVNGATHSCKEKVNPKQKDHATLEQCVNCGQLGLINREQTLKACGRCKCVRYCSPECQKSHWKRHKEDCVPQSCEAAPGHRYCSGAASS